MARASAERQRSVAALLTSAAVPGLTALALPTLSCLGYHRLFWMRCFGGCMSAPDVLSLDIPEVRHVLCRSHLPWTTIHLLTKSSPFSGLQEAPLWQLACHTQISAHPCLRLLS